MSGGRWYVESGMQPLLTNEKLTRYWNASRKYGPLALTDQWRES